MAPFYRGWDPYLKLSNDDKQVKIFKEQENKTHGQGWNGCDIQYTKF